MQFIRRAAIFAVLIGLIGQIIATGIVLGPTVDPVAARSDPELADALRFRTTFGFNASQAYVAASLVDKSAFPNLAYGVPLTAAEATEMDRRVALQDALTPASSFAAEQPDYAGVYVDQLQQGLPVFLFAGTPGSRASQIQALLPKGTAFRTAAVSRSFSDLVQLQATIDDATPDLLAHGIDVLLTGIDERANKVVVGLASDVSSGEATLRERFGDAISVRHQEQGQADACTGSADCPPLKGGIGIIAPDGGACTSAYIGKRTGTGQFVIVTAGHCLAVHGGSGQEWHHASGADLTRIGQAQQNTWVSGANADVGLIGIFTFSLPATKNQFLAAPGDIRQLTSRISLGNQHPGDVACRTGLTSGRTCGSIFITNVDRQSCVGTTCKTIHHMVEVDFDSTSGDSGAPYYFGSSGLGIHIHSDPDGPGAHGWYSPLDWAISEYQSRWGIPFTYCLTSAC